MPYHVVVTRQVLLDGPMVLFATLSLYFVARYAAGGRTTWLYAAGGAMGLTFLAKETSILLLGSIYAFFALTPSVRVRVRELVVATSIMGVVLSSFPLTLMLGGRANTGGQYLAWQLFRRPNHTWPFYFETVPEAIGFGILIVALAGLVLLRKRSSWRETLLLSWVVVPALFFQLWPVKGYQYLLPIAPPLAVLGARFAAAAFEPGRRLLAGWMRPTAVGLTITVAVAVSLVVPTWQQIQPSEADTFLAGSGGVPGGREAGLWIKAHVPEGAEFMTVGPSMANIVQFYGHRRAFGLSVSPNPLHRNPAYEPLPNPDVSIRNNDLQYLVWDSFSASRSPFFSEKLLRYAERYHGRVVHTESVTVETASGEQTEKPLIVIYEVRP